MLRIPVEDGILKRIDQNHDLGCCAHVSRSGRPVSWLAIGIAIFACVLFTLVGCHTDREDASKGKKQTDGKTSPDSDKARPVVAADAKDGAAGLLSEKWYSLRIQGAKVGHVHTRVRRDPQNPKLLHWHSEQSMTTLRLNQPLVQTIVLESWEEPSGRLRKWRWQDSTAGQKRGWTGVLRDGDFVAVDEAGAKQTLEWKAAWRGFFGEFQMLEESELKPGQVSRFKTLLPLLNQVADVEMKVIGPEEVATSLGPQKLLRVDSTLHFAQIAMNSVYWVDESGDVVKQWVRQGDIVMERTAKEIALAANEEFDLYDAVNVPVRRRVDDIHSKSTTTYTLRRKSGEPLKSPFSSDATQQVTENADGSLTIRVRRVTPESNSPAIPGFQVEAPTKRDLSGNTLIEVQDPLVQEMAASVARGGTDPWQIARDLELMVHGRIRKKNLSQGFNSAATTARLLEGDCTEHAVLLAAVCRARKIPCRVAVGLVYAQGLMAYHMWNEVWIEDRWIPLDATLGRGFVGPGHIKVRVSDLDGIAPFAAFVPVLELIGDLDIEISEVE